MTAEFQTPQTPDYLRGREWPVHKDDDGIPIVFEDWQDAHKVEYLTGAFIALKANQNTDRETNRDRFDRVLTMIDALADQIEDLNKGNTE